MPNFYERITKVENRTSSLQSDMELVRKEIRNLYADIHTLIAKVEKLEQTDETPESTEGETDETL